MKICLVISSLTPGGAERVMSTMANYWASQGVETSFITFDSEDSEPFYPLDSKINLRGLDLLRRSSSVIDAIKNNLLAIVKLRRAIRDLDPDVVISFLTETNVRTILASRGLSIPVVVSERNDPRSHLLSWPWVLARSLSYRLASHLVVQHSEMGEYFQSTMGQRVTVISNPVAIPPSASNHSVSPDGSETIVAVGRLVKQKGFDHLIKAFSAIAPQFPNWTLKIYGEGPDLQELRQLSVELGISQRIIFAGVTNSIAEQYQQAKVFVMPSRYEGFPNALCEAMSYGLPVITFDLPGTRAIVTDGSDGLLVPAENTGELSSALSKLLEDSALREFLGQNASLAIKRFSTANIMKQWDQLIAGLVIS